jgi:hypothetical protein
LSLLGADGKSLTDKSYRTTLLHWLSFESVRKVAFEVGVYPSDQELKDLYAGKVSNEDIAYWIRELTLNKKIRKTLLDCLASDPGMVKKGVTRAELKTLLGYARGSKSGLVLP